VFFRVLSGDLHGFWVVPDYEMSQTSTRVIQKCICNQEVL
jgi:hypothetical protein